MREMERFFQANKGDIDRAFTDKLEIFKRCIADGAITLKPELRLYDFCPPAGKLYNDFVVE
jgi:hypothetical protein